MYKEFIPKRRQIRKAQKVKEGKKPNQIIKLGPTHISTEAQTQRAAHRAKVRPSQATLGVGALGARSRPLLPLGPTSC
jgi:hypothetical protein